MTAEELIELLEERPFRPLRLHLSDGRTREIRHPEMALVSDHFVAIGIPRHEKSKVVRMTFCTIPNIVEVEPFEIEKPSGENGKHPPKKKR
jgi:hypothetical protein